MNLLAKSSVTCFHQIHSTIKYYIFTDNNNKLNSVRYHCDFLSSFSDNETKQEFTKQKISHSLHTLSQFTYEVSETPIHSIATMADLAGAVCSKGSITHVIFDMDGLLLGHLFQHIIFDFCFFYLFRIFFFLNLHFVLISDLLHLNLIPSPNQWFMSALSD